MLFTCSFGQVLEEWQVYRKLSGFFPFRVFRDYCGTLQCHPRRRFAGESQFGYQHFLGIDRSTPAGLD